MFHEVPIGVFGSDFVWKSDIKYIFIPSVVGNNNGICLSVESGINIPQKVSLKWLSIPMMLKSSSEIMDWKKMRTVAL